MTHREGPWAYAPHTSFKAPVDKKRCAASIWHAIGIGGDVHQCKRAGKFKIEGRLWCTMHAKKFPVAMQPEELRPKRVEGEKWWPGQTVYRVELEYGAFELLSGVVKSVRKDGVELVERSSVSRFKATMPFNEVFPSAREAYAAAVNALRVEIDALEKSLAKRRAHLATAEKEAQ